ncbi:adenine phosphoribosyltransferase [Caminibacter pacificus]|uniref:Adenine phosphoribosyltransferase n=1 Tax=Caminibacter pacificus TaxID=1424653 RepID=A0AAJ4RE40_9BACT|nr:adenine phosphoribosyltransferase [Caminibacter pacificus]NPA87900.1 adenine phosphoribosyltransferase [Campylobacterota bacterium]QCI28406.1 adenine phosphoribosyltransferase [Caminibacter pacificus]ROR40870.1 adenine phosphoribosyltransferase [Caminibacter pacificus]
MDLAQRVKNSIRDIPDYPKKGIIFKDITTLLNDGELFSEVIDYFAKKYENVDFVCGIESRGFIFGAAIAAKIKKGFVPLRKKGKLPYTTIAEKYALEYGFDEIEIHIDAFKDIKNPKVLLVDDLIATGGTAEAAIKLIQKIGGDVVAAAFLIELTFLDGADKIRELGVDVDSLVKY